MQDKRIFVLGDSLSAYSRSPGAVFANELRARGATVLVDAKVGRSANSLFVGEDGRGILAAGAAFRPDLVYVILGTNDMWLPNLAADKKQFERIRDAFPGATVWGVGPPSFRSTKLAQDAGRVVNAMRSVFTNFIDMRPLTPNFGRSPDGVHFAADGGEELGRRLAAEAVSRQAAIWRVVLAIGMGVGAWYLLRI